jgi:tripartite-type tricarboxylate transporter receptor subunit TctC
MEVAPGSPEEMAALMQKDEARWATVVREAGIKAE